MDLRGTNPHLLVGVIYEYGAVQESSYRVYCVAMSANRTSSSSKTIEQTIDTNLTVIGEWVIQSNGLAVEVVNKGAVAFNAFEIRLKATEASTFRLAYNQATDWTNPATGSLISIGNTTSPTTLAAGEGINFALFRLLDYKFYAIQFLASVASGSTVAEVSA